MDFPANPMQEGMDLLKSEDFRGAVQWFSQVISGDDLKWEPYNFRAIAHAKLGEYEKSLSDFSNALKRSPDNATILSDRALVYHFMGEKQKSMADFDRAAELEPENPYRYASRAFIKDRNGDLNGALEDYNMAIQLDPEDAISHNNRGMVEEKLGYKQKSQESFKMADELDQLLKSSNIDHSPKTPAPSVSNRDGSIRFDEPAKKNLTTVSFFKTLSKIFTSKKEFSEFIRFCKRLILGKGK